MTQQAGSDRLRIHLLAVSCLLLGACNGTSDPAGTSLEQSVPGGMRALAVPGGSAAQAPAAAVASLPADAGPVASVRAHAYVNGFRQDILLKGSAVRGVENGITVLARTSQQTTLDEATPLNKPTESAIRSELGRTFPHITMQVVERPSSNAYGPYGLALGRAGGTIHCIYAWQWVDRSNLGADAGIEGPVAIRVRLCKPDTTFDALADIVNHLSIRRDAAAGSLADAAVEPPRASKAEPARKRSALRHAHRSPGGKREADGTPVALATAPVVTQPLSTDLPPQAYLGPKSQPSSIKQH